MVKKEYKIQDSSRQVPQPKHMAACDYTEVKNKLIEVKPGCPSKSIY